MFRDLEAAAGIEIRGVFLKALLNRAPITGGPNTVVENISDWQVPPAESRAHAVSRVKAGARQQRLLEKRLLLTAKIKRTEQPPVDVIKILFTAC